MFKSFYGVGRFEDVYVAWWNWESIKVCLGKSAFNHRWTQETSAPQKLNTFNEYWLDLNGLEITVLLNSISYQLTTPTLDMKLGWGWQAFVNLLAEGSLQLRIDQPVVNVRVVLYVIRSWCTFFNHRTSFVYICFTTSEWNVRETSEVNTVRIIFLQNLKSPAPNNNQTRTATMYMRMYLFTWTVFCIFRVVNLKCNAHPTSNWYRYNLD